MPATDKIHQIKPSDLPAPPQAALEMLRACSKDNVDNRVLAGFAETDPVLTAEILRIVNTPIFGIGKEVTSVRHAVTLLGSRSLRNIILCLMVREAAQKFVSENFNITLFWEDSLRRAVVSSLIAESCGTDKDDAFSAAMMQDFGLLVLFYLNPTASLQYADLRKLNPEQRYQQEKELFGATHNELMVMLAGDWCLPHDLVDALSNHHQLEEAETVLAKILYCADWIDTVFNTNEFNRSLQQSRDIVNQLFSISEEQLQAMLIKLPAKVEQAASAMGLRIQQQLDFDQLLRQANTALARENVSYQELTWKLEKAIAERDRLSAELDREIAVAQEVQRKLMPANEIQGFPVHGFNLPARNVSGDFFDYFQHSSGKIWFTLGDVAGKGVNAGITMAKTVSLFHCLAKHMLDPEKLIRIINGEICETSIRGIFVSMVIGLYDPVDQTVQIVNAGSLPVIIDGKSNGIQRLPADEMPIGIMPDIAYQADAPVSLQNAALYLYSDGVTELKKEDGTMLGEKGLITLIEQHRNIVAAKRLSAMVKNLVTGTALHDDLTLLLLEP
ncbi:MAG: HDOD domain-containing protein [Thioalkalispiraceae bacterium]|jgi:serine phosphatase RsbU (regulator of sigma subunit)/HD-like signal output (HDOD) protein